MVAVNTWRGDAVIFDVDGTLCDVTSIRHHLIPSLPGWRGVKDFDAFHQASVWCPPIIETVAALHAARDAGLGVIIMTARMRKWEAHTRGWLAMHVGWFDALHMRADGDFRADAAVKADLLRDVRAAGWNVTHAWDDNPSIVKLWQMEGIPVTVVDGWIE